MISGKMILISVFNSLMIWLLFWERQVVSMKRFKRVLSLFMAFAVAVAFTYRSDNKVIRTQAVTLSEAEVALQKAQEVYDAGAFAFFEYRMNDTALSDAVRSGAETALAILNGQESGSKPAGFDGYTIKGDSKGSTSLQNISYALKGIEECNDCRALENQSEGTDLSPVSVNDICMAMAMKDANYSANIIGHAGVYNVAENVGWGYGYKYNSTSNLKAEGVFSGWYTEEKAVYKSGGNGQTGHYTNVVHKTVTASGFAVNQNSDMYGDCQAQVYDWFNYTGVSENISEYEAYFNNYYAKVTKDLEDAKALVAGLGEINIDGINIAPLNSDDVTTEDETESKEATTTEGATTTTEGATTTTEAATTTEALTTTAITTTTEATTTSNYPWATTAPSATTAVNATTESILSDDSDATISFASNNMKYEFEVSGDDYEVTLVKGKDVANVTIPKSITYNGVTYKIDKIGENAFKGCTKLKTVTIGENVEEIGENAFRGCTNLKKVVIGKNVEEIDDYAFYNCKKLKAIKIKSKKLTKSDIGKKAFAKTYSKVVVICPSGKKSKYKKFFKKAGISSKATFK